MVPSRKTSFAKCAVKRDTGPLPVPSALPCAKIHPSLSVPFAGIPRIPRRIVRAGPEPLLWKTRNWIRNINPSWPSWTERNPKPSPVPHQRTVTVSRQLHLRHPPTCRHRRWWLDVHHRHPPTCLLLRRWRLDVHHRTITTVAQRRRQDTVQRVHHHPTRTAIHNNSNNNNNSTKRMDNSHRLATSSPRHHLKCSPARKQPVGIPPVTMARTVVRAVSTGGISVKNTFVVCAVFSNIVLHVAFTQ